MTGIIDASLRRPILPQNIGDQVPDSQPLLEDTPQLIMEPGVSRPVFKFEDGDGLTDDFGNIYDGYGAAGGSSSHFINSVPESLDDNIDIASDGDILIFDSSRQFYEPSSFAAAGLIQQDGVAADLDFLQFNFASGAYDPKTYDEAGLAKVGGGVPQDTEFLQYVNANGQYEAKSHTEAGLAKVGGTAPTDTQILAYNNANGQYEPKDENAGAAPFDITDFISGIIEIPQNRTYTLVISLPYDITKTADAKTIGTGTATVTFPTNGLIAAGTPINITVSATSVDAEFLRFQIDFTRTLTP